MNTLRASPLLRMLDLAAIGCLLTACGGGGVAPATSSAPAAATAPAAPAKPAAATAVTVVIAASNMIESAAKLAQQDGTFQRHGIAATVTQIAGSTTTMAALQAGDVQFALTTGEAVLLGQSKHLPIVSVAALNSGSTTSLVLSNKYLQAHPLPSNASLEQRAALLNGAILGTVSSTDDTNAKYLMQIAHLPATAYKSVKMQNQQAQVAAIKQGEIDGMLLSAPESFQAVAQGSGQIVLNARDVPKWDQFPYIVALTTKGYAKDHPDSVKAALASVEEALAKMAAGGPDVLSFERTVYPNYSDDVLQKSLDIMHLAPYKPMTQAQWDLIGQLELDSGQLTTPFSPEEETDWTNDFLPSPPAGKA